MLRWIKRMFFKDNGGSGQVIVDVANTEWTLPRTHFYLWAYGGGGGFGGSTIGETEFTLTNGGSGGAHGNPE